MEQWELDYFNYIRKITTNGKDDDDPMAKKLPRDIAVYSDNYAGGKQLMASMGMFQRRDFTSFADGVPKFLVNWGALQLPSLPPETIILNKSAAIMSVFQNKVQARWQSQGIRVPEISDDVNKVINDLIEGRQWYGMSNTLSKVPVFYEKGSAGRFVRSLVFTRCIKPKEQYRLHFLHKQIIATQKRVQVKALPDGTPVPVEKLDQRFRGFATGWDLENIEEAPFHIQIEASRAFKATQLDFGSIEIIDDGSLGYVTEVKVTPHLNPGLTDSYANAFKKLLTKAA